MQLTITQDDITKGIRLNPKCCPIAVALRKVFNSQVTDVSVGYTNTIVYLPPHSEYDLAFKCFENPKPLAKFLHEFDTGLKPGETVLDLEWDIPTNWLKK